MLHSYIAFDPAATVNGETLQAVNRVLHIPQDARRLLKQYGLPSQPVRGQWYPLQGWLNLLGELETGYGEQTVYAVGLQIAECSVWPDTIGTLEQALYALDEACQANVDSSPMGYYRTQVLAPRTMRVVCYTPTPTNFEWGLITGVARKFKPVGSIRIRVEPEDTPTDSPVLLKWFRVSWT